MGKILNADIRKSNADSRRFNSSNLRTSASKRTIWLKIASIALAGTFALQANALALKYGDYADDILPDYKWERDALGFAITVASPFVASGLGDALGIGAQAAGQGGSQIGNIGQFLLNPSGLAMGTNEALIGNMIIYHSAATAGQTLGQMGQLYWGMSPQESQYLGMVGSSMTTFGLGAVTNPDAISGIYANGSLANFASTHPITTGMITGAGFGAIAGGINLGVQEALKDSVSPYTASMIGSLAGNSLGAGVWGGLTRGFGLTGSPRQIDPRFRAFAEVANQWLDELPSTTSTHTDFSALVATVQVADKWLNEVPGIVGVQPAPPNFGQKFAEGFKTSLFGNTTEEARKAGMRQFGKELGLRGIDIGVAHIAEKSGMEPQYASIAGTTGSMAIGNLSYALAGDKAEQKWWALRESTIITNNTTLNAVIEPAIYGPSAYAMTKLTEGENEPYKVALTNMGAFILASAASSGIHALTTDPIARTKMTQGEPTRWDVFKEDMAIKVNDFAQDSVGFGAYTGQRLLVQEGSITNYTGALQLSKLWNFAGLDDFALRAHQIEEMRGDWRLADLTGNSFRSMLNRASGMARYHTIKNMELSSYSLIKSTSALDFTKHSSVQIRAMAEDRSPEEISFINKTINSSMEPPVYAPERGQIKLVDYDIGIGKDGIEAFNKTTKEQFYSPGLYEKYHQDYLKNPQRYLEHEKHHSEPKNIYDLYDPKAETVKR